MWLRDRCTARRGRSGVPSTRFRMRRWMVSLRCLRLGLLIAVSLLRAGLAGLQPDHLAEVPDALALVGVGRTQSSETSGHLADGLLVNASDDDLVAFLDRD